MTSYALKTSTSGPNVFLYLVFLYFLVLSGDCLEVAVGAYSIKLSRVLGVALFCALLLSNRFRVMEKTLFYCFLWIFGSFLLSSFFSGAFMASLGGCGAGLIAYVCFFLVPLNLMRLFDKDKLLRIYFLSFVCVGLHALAQCLLSFFGIIEPFALQTIGATQVVRGQSWLYEPSYYALFATPFVFFLNARYLLRSVNSPRLITVLGANFLLIVSTSTGAFFSYFIFFCLCLVFSCFSMVKRHFSGLRRRVCRFAAVFLVCMGALGLCFKHLFLHTFLKFFYIGFFLHWSFIDRYDKIVECWNIFCSAPFFGIGLRSIEHYLYLTAHFNTEILLNADYQWKELFARYTATNVLMEVLASLGLFGLSAFVVLGLVVVRLFCATIRDPRVSLEEKKTLFSFFLSAVMMMICLQFNQELFRNYVWAHMGISVGYLLKVRVLASSSRGPIS